MAIVPLGSFRQLWVPNLPPLSFVSVYTISFYNVGKYSLNHLHQKRFARYWACLQLLLQHESFLSNNAFLSNTPGGKLVLGRKCNNWFGVNGSSSMGLSLLRVRGLEFMMCIASGITVWRTSSETTCSLRTTFKLCLTDLIMRSHTPPMWLADRGLKDHFIPLCTEIVNLTLVPFFYAFVQFLVCTHEICFLCHFWFPLDFHVYW